MFIYNDNTIYVTRGDIGILSVTAEDNGEKHIFKQGDLLRLKVFEKKNCSNVVLQKDTPVTSDTESVDIYLTERDTKIGGVISKPVDYWYEIELNPLSDPQTIIGYDEDGAKVFKLFPEGKDVEEHEYTPEEIPFMDDELDLSSTRPVENQAIARAIEQLKGSIQRIDAASTELSAMVSLERARTTSLASLDEGSTTGDAELQDIRVDNKGTIHASAGESTRAMTDKLDNALSAICKNIGFKVIDLRDLPVEHHGAYITNNGEIVQANDKWSVRRYTPPSDAVFLHYEYGNQQQAFGCVYDAETNEIVTRLGSKDMWCVTYGKYFLITHYDGDDNFIPKYIHVYTHNNGGLTNGWITDESTLFATNCYYGGNVPVSHANSEVHKIIRHRNHDYYCSAVTKISTAISIGCQYNNDGVYLGELTADRTTGKLNLKDGCDYFLANVFGGENPFNVSSKYIGESEAVADYKLHSVVNKPFAFNRKTAVVFGDSITAGVTSNNLAVTANSYINLFAKRAGLTLTNRAVSGSTIANYRIESSSTPISERVVNNEEHFDFIIISGGVNDHVTGRPIGSFGDTDDTTVYGAMRKMCESLKAKHPTSEVIFITPVNVTKEFPNAILPLKDYRRAIYEVALSYGFSVVNGEEMGMPDEDSTFANLLIGSADGCHPTELGHKIYANALATMLL